MPRKIKGTFCERALAPKSRFDRRSFRWKKSGAAWVLVGCPKGKFSRGRCRVGMRAHKLLARAKAGRCRRGGQKVRKG